MPRLPTQPSRRMLLASFLLPFAHAAAAASLSGQNQSPTVTNWPDSGLPFRLRADQAVARARLQSTGAACQVVFSNDDKADLAPVELPAAQARLLGKLPLAGQEVVLAAFDLSVTVSAFAVIGWDGGRTRILAIEPGSLSGNDDMRMSTRLAATSDGKMLRLLRQLSAPRGPTLPYHLQWTDWLGFRARAPLCDAAPRPPYPGTCQARLSTIRAHLIALLEQSQAMTPAALAATGLLDLPHQFALALGKEAYPADMSDP